MFALEVGKYRRCDGGDVVLTACYHGRYNTPYATLCILTYSQLFAKYTKITMKVS